MIVTGVVAEASNDWIRRWAWLLTRTVGVLSSRRMTSECVGYLDDFEGDATRAGGVSVYKPQSFMHFLLMRMRMRMLMLMLRLTLTLGVVHSGMP